jgi:hypothetical protein
MFLKYVKVPADSARNLELYQLVAEDDPELKTANDKFRKVLKNVVDSKRGLTDLVTKYPKVNSRYMYERFYRDVMQKAKPLTPKHEESELVERYIDPETVKFYHRKVEVMHK